MISYYSSAILLHNMTIYQVLGVKTFYRTDIAYIVDASGRIQKDAQGNAMTEPRDFTHYILYIQDKLDAAFYSIELFDTVSASFEKHTKICRYGHMHISAISQNDIDAAYMPLRELVFEANFHVGIYDFEDDIDVYEYQAECPNSQSIFAFSANAGNERYPDGYVFVNMEYYYKVPKEFGCDISCNPFAWFTR